MRRPSSVKANVVVSGARTIPPVRQASVRTLREPLDPTRCMLGSKSDPVSLDTVWTTMTAAKEAGHEGQGAKAHHDSWQ
jgi:hypothetical protein